jgi:hypothetical protein
MNPSVTAQVEAGEVSLIASQERRSIAARLATITRFGPADSPEAQALRRRIDELRVEQIEAWAEEVLAWVDAARERLPDPAEIADRYQEAYRRHREASHIFTGNGTAPPSDMPDGKVISAEPVDSDIVISRKSAMRAGKKRKQEAGGFAGGAPPFGWRIREGELEPDPHEHPIRARILELRLAGGSYREIGAAIEDEGHRARRGGTRWDPETIRRIVLRAEQGRPLPAGPRQTQAHFHQPPPCPPPLPLGA